jgi:hypothetical protein
VLLHAARHHTHTCVQLRSEQATNEPSSTFSLDARLPGPSSEPATSGSVAPVLKLALGVGLGLAAWAETTRSRMSPAAKRNEARARSPRTRSKTNERHSVRQLRPEFKICAGSHAHARVWAGAGRCSRDHGRRRHVERRGGGVTAGWWLTRVPAFFLASVDAMGVRVVVAAARASSRTSECQAEECRPAWRPRGVYG